jgi:hypothetical protein
MKIFDLREFGPITLECERYIGALLASVSLFGCPIKNQLLFTAREKCGWSEHNMMPYAAAGYLGDTVPRINGPSGVFSPREWLCALFSSGNVLSVEHLRITLQYVNPKVTPFDVNDGVYNSGKDFWVGLPQPLNRILDFFDEAAIKKEEVKVICACAHVLPEKQEMLEKEGWSEELLKECVEVHWE